MATKKRPTWDKYFMQLAILVGTRGTCDRGYAGTVIVKDKRIISTGYVGAPVGLPHCDEVGHEMHEIINPDGTTSKHCIRTTHSEQNAIIMAARFGIAIDGSTLYTKMEPCYVCAKMIINAGIKRVVAERKYHGATITRKIFKKAGVKLEVLIDEEVEYTNKK